MSVHSMQPGVPISANILLKHHEIAINCGSCKKPIKGLYIQTEITDPSTTLHSACLDKFFKPAIPSPISASVASPKKRGSDPEFLSIKKAAEEAAAGVNQSKTSMQNLKIGSELFNAITTGNLENFREALSNCPSLYHNKDRCLAFFKYVLCLITDPKDTRNEMAKDFLTPQNQNVKGLGEFNDLTLSSQMSPSLIEELLVRSLQPVHNINFQKACETANWNLAFIILTNGTVSDETKTLVQEKKATLPNVLIHLTRKKDVSLSSESDNALLTSTITDSKPSLSPEDLFTALIEVAKQAKPNQNLIDLLIEESCPQSLVRQFAAQTCSDRDTVIKLLSRLGHIKEETFLAVAKNAISGNWGKEFLDSLFCQCEMTAATRATLVAYALRTLNGSTALQLLGFQSTILPPIKTLGKYTIGFLAIGAAALAIGQRAISQSSSSNSY